VKKNLQTRGGREGDWICGTKQGETEDDGGYQYAEKKLIIIQASTEFSTRKNKEGHKVCPFC
jgi:hypothetical protein